MYRAYYDILEYNDNHPQRLVVILFFIVAIFILFLYVLFRQIRAFKNKQKLTRKSKSINLKNLKLRKTPSKKSGSKLNNGRFFSKNKILYIVILIQFLVILVLLAIVFSSRKRIAENTSIYNSDYVFGIDISHYQDRIDWNVLRTSGHPIEFVFIRATMGADGIDSQFHYNWENAKANNYIRGAYHYYRPNQNSSKQFENFKSVVNIEEGDFIPILDIEKESQYGHENLREGVVNWLKLAEQEYGVKPMIYTGLTFYKDILEGHVNGYPLWIAAYSGKHRIENVQWSFHQFTEDAKIKGIKTKVDANNFRGDIADLEKMLINKVN